MGRTFLNNVRQFAKSWIGSLDRKTTKQRDKKQTVRTRCRAMRVESLESRQLLSAIGMNITSGDLVLTGGAEDDNVTVSYNPTTARYTFKDPANTFSTAAISGSTGDGTNTATVPAAAVVAGKQIILNLDLGTDTVTLDLTVVTNPAASRFQNAILVNGGLASDTLFVNLHSNALLPLGGIDFEANLAAVGSNTMQITGDDLTASGQSVTYKPDGIINGSGKVYAGSDSTNFIQFARLDPVNFTGLNSVTIQPQLGDQAVGITNSIVPSPSLEIAPTGGTGAAFEKAYVWNNTNVVIDTTLNPGLGAVTVNSANNAHANANLSILTGIAADTISIAGLVVVTGNVTLSANGAVTQSQAIAATGLELKGSGSYTLTNPGNAVTTIAGNTTNTISYVNASALAIGTVNTVGLTSTNTVTLTAGGAISQTSPIKGTTLTVKTKKDGGAAIALLDSSNEFATINLQARNTGDTINDAGAISYRDATGVDVSGVATTSTVNLTAGGAITDSGAITGTTLTTSSVGGTVLDFGDTVTGFNATNTTSGNIQLVNTGALSVTGISQAGGGNVIITNTGTVGINGLATVTGGNLTLTATDAVSQTAAITAGTLTVKTKKDGGAAITLPNNFNDVSTIDLRTRNTADTANAAGAISYLDATGFTVAAVSTTSAVPLTLTAGGGITHPPAAAINAGGTVTLNVGASNIGSASSIAGTIVSAGQVTVNGGNGADILNVQLATAHLGAAGLIFNGGIGSPNVLLITSKVGNNVYCVEEGSTSTIFHGTAENQPYDAKLSYNSNVQKVQIDGNNSVDNVTVSVSNIQTPTQFWLNATAGKQSTLKIDAIGHTVQKYAIGNLSASTLAPDLVTSTLVWNAGTNPFVPLRPGTTALPLTVPQKFSINNVALLQYFGGMGNDCVINNTSTNSLMVGGGGKATLVGGKGSNELLGGAGTSQLIGRGTVDYLLANYTVDYTGVVAPNNGILKKLAVTNGNYIYDFPSGPGLSLVLYGSNDQHYTDIKVILPQNSGKLTTLEWLKAVLWKTENIVKQAQSASMLRKLPGCPDKLHFSG